MFGKNKIVWEYGTCRDRIARRHKTKRNVQFVLWEAGEQGHNEDFWHNFDYYWWGGFVPDKAEVVVKKRSGVRRETKQLILILVIASLLGVTLGLELMFWSFILCVLLLCTVFMSGMEIGKKYSDKEEVDIYDVSEMD